GETVQHIMGWTRLPDTALPSFSPTVAEEPVPDLTEVRGQEMAKRALEVAAAGGHNLLFLGPPGSGKTMLARRLPGLLPPLTLAESIAVTKIHSLVAEQPPSGLIHQRPFRSPHPGTSTAGMIGGTSLPRPGEASLAHNGVLFLDELPEFRRDTLEALRQPLEEGKVHVVRARSLSLPAPPRLALLAAMNPCPCGHLGDPRHDCRCPAPAIERYRARISGPLLDRIDLHVEVPAVSLHELRSNAGESTATVAARIGLARARQLERFGPQVATPINAAMTSSLLRQHCPLDAPGRRLLDAAFEKLGLSARALDRLLKVARTLADLEGADQIRSHHLAEAIHYRALDRRLVG
ncbi:MAG: YifB family Mg chelatase-like AAA ATPase, partial [Acidobacteriota bacterium]|nr:YifB family Mg chelatase-like AAA ATPase [Acidobacteriota bacterium]